MLINRKKLMSSVAALLTLSATALASRPDEAHSDTQPPEGLEAVQLEAEALLKSSFSSMQFYSIKPSLVQGLYEIDTGNNIIYFNSEANVLIFGQMYNHLGENLSEKAISAAAAERLKDIDLSVALTFGPDDAPVITEYSNPLCGWCQRLHDWFDSELRDLPVKRQIVFAVGHSTQAQDLAEHILCSDDPEQAFADIYSRRRPARLERCEEGYDRVQAHIQITQAAGVSSTPTLFADGERIRGFDEAKIREYLLTASQTVPSGGR